MATCASPPIPDPQEKNAEVTMQSNSTPKIRYAVIGAGNIAQVGVLPAFAHAAENSELVAIISSDPEKREKLTAKYDVEAVGDYDNLERILEEADVDAAYIALPNHLHRAFTERCAAVGVHVLCEKPMAMSVNDCEAMIEATDAADVMLMIAYRLHFEETNLRALESVRAGKIGDPTMFSSMFTHQVKAGDIRARSDQFTPELVYFSQCIMDDIEPEPSGEEGLCDVRPGRVGALGPPGDAAALRAQQPPRHHPRDEEAAGAEDRAGQRAVAEPVTVLHLRTPESRQRARCLPSWTRSCPHDDNSRAGIVKRNALPSPRVLSPTSRWDPSTPLPSR